MKIINMKIANRTILALAVVTLIFMELLDGTILNTAIPSIATSFGISVLTLKTAITSYLIILAILTPVSGYVADRFGIKHCLNAAVTVFLLGSILCSMATSATELSLFRMIQGAGSAMMTPVGRLLFLRMYEPKELARATSTISIPVLFGPLLGPLLGGAISTYLSWHWIFLINIPFGILALFLINRYMPSNNKTRVAKFSWGGFLLVAVCFASIDVSLESYGNILINQSLITVLFILGIISALAYLLHHKHTSFAIIDLYLLKIKLFRFSIINTVLAMCASGAMGFLIPILLQRQLQLTPMNSGLLTFPIAIGALMVKPLLSKIYQWLGGFTNTLIISSAMVSISILLFAGLDYDFSILKIAMLEILFGISYGLMLNVNAISAFYEVNAEQKSKATSFQSSMFLFSISLSVGVSSLIFSSRLKHNNTFLGDLHDSVAVFKAFHQCVIILGLISLLSTIILWAANNHDRKNLSITYGKTG